MAEATNEQIQYALERYRRVSEQVRALYTTCLDVRATIEDVYNAANKAGDFEDARIDVPHKATLEDIKAFNDFAQELIDFINGNGNYPVLQKLCVRPVID